MPLIPASGPVSMSMLNVAVGRSSTTVDSLLASGSVPADPGLFYLGYQINNSLNQAAPHAISEWYNFDTTTSTTTTTTTAAGATTTTTTSTTSTTTQPPLTITNGAVTCTGNTGEFRSTITNGITPYASVGIDSNSVSNAILKATGNWAVNPSSYKIVFGSGYTPVPEGGYWQNVDSNKGDWKNIPNGTWYTAVVDSKTPSPNVSPSTSTTINCTTTTTTTTSTTSTTTTATPPTVYYQVEVCGGGDGPYIVTLASGDSPSGINQAYKLSGGGYAGFNGSTCWIILDNAASGPADYTGVNFGTVYSNCTDCQNAGPMTTTSTTTTTTTGAGTTTTTTTSTTTSTTTAPTLYAITQVYLNTSLALVCTGVSTTIYLNASDYATFQDNGNLLSVGMVLRNSLGSGIQGKTFAYDNNPSSGGFGGTFNMSSTTGALTSLSSEQC